MAASVGMGGNRRQIAPANARSSPATRSLAVSTTSRCWGAALSTLLPGDDEGRSEFSIGCGGDRRNHDRPNDSARSAEEIHSEDGDRRNARQRATYQTTADILRRPIAAGILLRHSGYRPPCLSPID